MSSTASLNSADGFFIEDVSAKGAATDFKVTVDDSTANANLASGIHIVNAERALIEDSSANDNVTEGIQLAFISDDVTIKRSETNRNADGILMSDVNDANLQFTDAKGNAADGLRSRFGSTIHATGGSYSENGASGWDIEGSGDVSTFGSTISSNADHGLKISNPGAVHLASTTITANGTHGFEVSEAAWATLTNLNHVGNVADSVITGTPVVSFTSSTGEFETKDDVQLKTVLSDANGKDPIVIGHTRTIADGNDETAFAQDDIAIKGASSVTMNGGDGDDRLAATDWIDEATTGLSELAINGGDGKDHIVVAFSTETELIVNGDAPDVAPGDRLTLESAGIDFTDDGEKMVAVGKMDIRYHGIESVQAEQSDTQSPTVQIVEVDASGPIGEVTIRFSEPVTGLDIGDLRITRNGSDLDLSAASLLSSDGGTIWTIGNLSETTKTAGDYKMELLAIDSAIEDLFGNDLQSGDAEDWTNTPGDANGDGVCDSSDLIAAFVANKYGTDEPATHAEGDWNNDGVFNSSDLIYVFANGNYAG